MTDAGARFARHVMLAEIGVRGQETLSAARYHVPDGADPRVASVIRTYLDRAGLVASEDGVDVELATEDVERVSRAPRLAYATAYLLGALASVEHVKTTLGLGRPMKTPLSPLA